MNKQKFDRILIRQIKHNNRMGNHNNILKGGSRTINQNLDPFINIDNIK